MYNFLSLLTGILITIMISFNGILSNYIGNYSSTFVIHLVGIIILSFIFLIKKYKIKVSPNISLIFYSAGIIGVFTVLLNNLSFTNLGASLTISLGLLGQTISSLIIDSFGLIKMRRIKFEKRKLLGISMIMVGITIMALF
ncbi:DMT family transporter [Clostridium nigeriense]|uniref:DMT family transporter n=1 Tax=Clostridium nigeriense TaxID=1805470 RepID=UPI00082B4DF0|nr:DMT family transporter [Clostridium nigeriense]